VSNRGKEKGQAVGKTDQQQERKIGNRSISQKKDHGTDDGDSGHEGQGCQGSIAGSFRSNFIEKTLGAHQQQSGQGKGKPAGHCVPLGSKINA
jgi:hypothetical protein